MRTHTPSEKKMALVPYESNDWLDFKRRYWGTEILPTDLWPTPASWSAYRELCKRNGYVRPWLDTYTWTDLDCIERDVKITRDVFQVRLDVHHFRSYEITVKIEGNAIVIRGKHDKRPKVNGYIERQFERRYDLSSDFRVRDVTSTLSSDGILTVKAYPTLPAITPSVRFVPVTQTFRPSYWD